MSITFCTSVIDAARKRCCRNLGDTCIASECMAWRWVKTHVNDGHGGPMIESTDSHGYCGLAGKPWGVQ